MPPENLQPTKSQTLTDIAESAEKALSENNKQLNHIVTQSPFGESSKKEYTPNPELKTLRTFQGDMEETIHNKKESIVSIAVAEQNTKKRVAPEFLPQKNTSVFLTYGILPLAGLILILVGATTLGIIYFYRALNNAPVAVSPQTTLISSAKKQESTVGTDPRNDIIQQLTNGKKTFSNSAGSILYIQFVKNATELPATDFFQYIAPSAQGALARSFGKEYMSGVYSFDTNEIFFILSTTDYGQTYSGMLKWESTMAQDLSPFYPKIATNITGVVPFQDDSFNNHDVRVLRDATGQTVLMYGFIDKNTLIITANEKVFQSIANKYINSKLVH